MSDDWNDVDYSIPHHVGDVWADDNANGADGRRRRLLCGGVSCALFEADGGAWRNEAMSDVAAYIIKQLSGRNLPEGMFTVIY